MTMKITVFWDVTSYSLEIGETCCLHLQCLKLMKFWQKLLSPTANLADLN
jgi:hypothetical protein